MDGNILPYQLETTLDESKVPIMTLVVLRILQVPSFPTLNLGLVLSQTAAPAIPTSGFSSIFICGGRLQL